MKVRDRLLLGLIAGLGANIPKLLIGRAGLKLKTADLHGPEIAAGIFIPGHHLVKTTGKIIGYAADASIAGMLGTVMVYGLSFTGKDYYLLKGAAAGQIMWETIYGLFTSFGVTQIKTLRPKTVLNEFVSHTAYGIAAAAIAANLGHESLFTGKMPLSASSGDRKLSRALPPGNSALEDQIVEDTRLPAH